MLVVPMYVSVTVTTSCTVLVDVTSVLCSLEPLELPEPCAFDTLTELDKPEPDETVWLGELCPGVTITVQVDLADAPVGAGG